MAHLRHALFLLILSADGARVKRLPQIVRDHVAGNHDTLVHAAGKLMRIPAHPARGPGEMPTSVSKTSARSKK